MPEETEPRSFPRDARKVQSALRPGGLHRVQLTFLAVAVFIVVITMIVAGALVSLRTAETITRGVADTTAASMDTMLADELAEIGTELPLPDAARADLDEIFSAANNAPVNRLIQIRLHNPDDSLLYESIGGLLDPPSAADEAEARRGLLTASVVDLPLVAVGPGTAGTLSVLKVVAPIHNRSTGTIEATADLYFSARGLLDLQSQLEHQVWMIIGLVGLLAIGALYLLVDRTSRIILAQERGLAQTLAAAQRLTEEKVQLRRQANVANERLLTQVGSDLHDGPLQLLAAHMLNLSRPGRRPRSSDIALAQRAIEELRSISAGLVLPELSDLSFSACLALAARRHEEMTGTTVRTRFADLPREPTSDLKACLYRVVQEGLGNAARHGVSGSAALETRSADGQVIIEITNLLGTSHAVAPKGRPRLGLDGMRARLEAVGGGMMFESNDTDARLRVYPPL